MIVGGNENGWVSVIVVVVVYYKYLYLLMCEGESLGVCCCWGCLNSTGIYGKGSTKPHV